MVDMSDKDKVRGRLEGSERMQAEWRAWRQVCLRLEKQLPRDRTLNDCPMLAAALRLWGEELVNLRLYQHAGFRDKALQVAREEYSGFLPDSRDGGFDD